MRRLLRLAIDVRTATKAHANVRGFYKKLTYSRKIASPNFA